MEEAIKIEANQQWAGQDKAKHPFVFTIETKSGRVYFIAAPSKEMMITWVDKLSSTFKFYLMNNSEDAAASGACIDRARESRSSSHTHIQSQRPCSSLAWSPSTSP